MSEKLDFTKQVDITSVCKGKEDACKWDQLKESCDCAEPMIKSARDPVISVGDLGVMLRVWQNVKRDFFHNS